MPLRPALSLAGYAYKDSAFPPRRACGTNRAFPLTPRGARNHPALLAYSCDAWLRRVRLVIFQTQKRPTFSSVPRSAR